MGKKAVEMGRYGASELMRNKNLQKKAVNYGINKLTPFIQDSVGTAMDELSTKIRHGGSASPHSSIKMTPVEASKNKNKNKVWSNLYGDSIYLKPGKSKFAIGDRVRISKYKRKVFDKGYTPNWTEEIFVIDKVLPTKPVTYRIVDLMGEEIKGSFYNQELQKTKQQTFRIEKIIRRDNKKKMALVKWSGYPDKFNSWVSSKDLVDF